MKNIALIITLALSMTTGLAQAQNNGIDGLIFDAGSGALIGQAIGRNTEATLIGGAVGTMLGYMVGNEMDKSGFKRRIIYRQPIVRYQQPRNVYVKPEPLCRETEMLAEINGQAEKVYGTACLQDGEWVMSTPETFTKTRISQGDRKHHRKKYYKKHRKHRHYDDDHDRRVAYRRFR